MLLLHCGQFAGGVVQCCVIIMSSANDPVTENGRSMSQSPEIVARLRNSPRGRLEYDRHCMNEEGKLHEILNEASQNIRFTSLRQSYLSALNPLWVSASPVMVISSKEIEMLDDRISSKPTLPDNVFVADVELNTSEQGLRCYDDQRRKFVQDIFNQKRDTFSRHSNETYQKALRSLEELQSRRKLEEELRAKDLEAKQEASKHASQKRHQKLKDEHVSLAKLSDERLKEATLKDKLEQEAANERKLAWKRIVSEFSQHTHGVNSAYQEIEKLITSCKAVHLLSADVRHAIQSANEVLDVIHKIVKNVSAGRLIEKDIEVASSCKDRITSNLAIIRAGVEQVNKTFKDEDNLPLRTEVKQVTSPLAQLTDEIQDDMLQRNLANSQNVTSPPVTFNEKKIIGQQSSASTSSLKRYLHYIDLLEKNRESCQELVTNAGLKKYRFELQKAINTPVNAISSQSGSHLRDKLERLLKLLAKHPVDASEKLISISDHPQGRQFCLDLLAKKFVRQGEEQVSSSHKAAFPIAAVIVGLWSKDETFGELLLGHFFAKCPFLVPYHLPRQEGQSDEEYYSALGYNIADGTLEQSDQFLKRISGVVRLYAAILQSPLPPGITPPHPHGLENGWMWLARVLNTDPLPDVTATVLFDFLDMCGHSLHKQYGRQFQKLLLLLCQDYFPKIRAVTSASSGGPITRLETFLQKCVRQGHISQPEGILSHDFWFSSNSF